MTGCHYEGKERKPMRSGRITAVHRDSKYKHRYHVDIEGERAFSVHEDILVKYNLLKGSVLDEAFIGEVLLAEEENKAYLLALRYLGIRPRTSFQVKKYLREKGFSTELAEKIVQRCEHQGYVNDKAFSRQWVQERLRVKPRSAYVLRMELQQRGVDGEIADEAVRSVSLEDELEAARRLVAKRLRSCDVPPDTDTERKLLVMLMRRGFSGTVLQQIRREWRQREKP
jgi:regulatory protein